MPTTKKTPDPAKKNATRKSARTKTIASRVGTTADGSVAVAKKRSASVKKNAPKEKSPAVSAKGKKSVSGKRFRAAENLSAGLGLVKRCVAALAEKKASNIEVVFLGEKSPVTDYCVIATGTSDPHLRAIRIELEKAIRDVVPAAHVRVQNEPNSGWCVVDAFDVVVHVFSQDRRETYALEELWKDGERLAPEDFS